MQSVDRKNIEVAWNRGFADSEINDILRMIETNLNFINETYEQLFAMLTWQK